MNKTSKIILTAIIVITLLILIGVLFAKEGSIFLFLIRLVVGLAGVTILMSAIFSGFGIPKLISEKCPNCKSLNSFSKVEEIIDDRAHTVYKKCRSCGYKKPYK